MLYRTIDTRAEKVTDRTFRFVISDESVDRYGSIILLDGWQLENYGKNPVVAYQHLTWSSNPDLILGKGRVWIEDRKLWGEVEFEPDGENIIADKVVKKLNFGSISATSVGFDPFEWSWGDKSKGENPDLLYFRGQDLLEFSIVHLPANANATIQKSFEDFIKTVRKAEDTPPGETKPPDTPKPTGPDPYRTKFLNQILKSVQ